jgi:hypothetical protein
MFIIYLRLILALTEVVTNTYLFSFEISTEG